MGPLWFVFLSHNSSVSHPFLNVSRLFNNSMFYFTVYLLACSCVYCISPQLASNSTPPVQSILVYYGHASIISHDSYNIYSRAGSYTLQCMCWTVHVLSLNDTHSNQ